MLRRVLLAIGLVLTSKLLIGKLVQGRRGGKVQSVDGSNEASPEEHTESHAWLRMSFLIAAVVGGLAIWPGFDVFSQQHQPTGGLLFARSVVKSPAFGEKQTASIGIRAWETGVGGVDMLAVTIDLDQAEPNGKWFVVASGDFAVRPDLEGSMYCKYGEGRRTQSGVVCPSVLDNPTISFLFNEPLASSYAEDGKLFGVHDLEGYDARSSTVISGRNPTSNSAGRSLVEIYLPISHISLQSIGEDRRVSLPSVGFESPIQWGQGESMKNACTTQDTEPLFVLPSSCESVTELALKSMDLVIDQTVGPGYVEASSPATLTNDALHWKAEASLFRPQAILANPYYRHSESMRAFFAALIIGFAAPVASPLGGTMLRCVEAVLSFIRRSLR